MNLFTFMAKHSLMPEPENFADLLKKNDEAIRKLYEDNRNGFILFAKRYDLDQEDIVDIYQDAIIALCENATKGKLDNLQSTVKTYLFAIGKFMIFQKLKTINRVLPLEDSDFITMEWNDYNEEKNDFQVAALQKNFSKLGQQCQKVLRFFYYEEKKLDEIQEILNYTNKDVLKSQKSRCLKQLKELIQKS